MDRHHVALGHSYHNFWYLDGFFIRKYPPMALDKTWFCSCLIRLSVYASADIFRPNERDFFIHLPAIKALERSGYYLFNCHSNAGSRKTGHEPCVGFGWTDCLHFTAYECNPHIQKPPKIALSATLR